MNVTCTGAHVGQSSRRVIILRDRRCGRWHRGTAAADRDKGSRYEGPLTRSCHHHAPRTDGLTASLRVSWRWQIFHTFNTS